MNKELLKERLREERIKRKMSQGQIAEILHIKRESYTLYETGTNTPTLENMCILADYYNLSIDYLVGRYNT